MEEKQIPEENLSEQGREAAEEVPATETACRTDAREGEEKLPEAAAGEQEAPTETKAADEQAKTEPAEAKVADTAAKAEPAEAKATDTAAKAEPEEVKTADAAAKPEPKKAALPSESMNDFKEELDNSFRKIAEGDILKGTVIGVTDTEVMVDIRYYTQGVIPAAEYSNDPRFSIRHDVNIGDEIEATVTKTDDGHGNILLSRKAASDTLIWDRLKDYQKENREFTVKVDSAVKGGVVAFLEDTRGFIPASKLALSFVEEADLAGYVGKMIRVRVADVDREKKKLILSAREILRAEAEKARAAKVSNVRVGLVTEGTVESLKDYGAFVDLGEGLSGLLHISQIPSEKRLKYPGEVLKVGQRVKVKVTQVKDGKLSLSMKALEEAAAEEVREELAEFKSEGEATTSLADLLKKAGF